MIYILLHCVRIINTVFFCISELSKVLENTAFFTDLIVRFPKPSHIFYKKNKNSWKKIIKAATNICEYSGVFDGEYATLLHNVITTNIFYKYYTFLKSRFFACRLNFFFFLGNFSW